MLFPYCHLLCVVVNLCYDMLDAYPRSSLYSMQFSACIGRHAPDAEDRPRSEALFSRVALIRTYYCRDIMQATRRRCSTSQDQHRRKKQSEQQGVNGNVPVPHTSCPVPGTENDISQSVVLDRPKIQDDLRLPIPLCFLTGLEAVCWMFLRYA
jgi:hypothetical protein